MNNGTIEATLAEIARVINASLSEAKLEVINEALEPANPPGWREVDGVKLPPINWAEPRLTGQDAIDAAHDHIRDLRKHGK